MIFQPIQQVDESVDMPIRFECGCVVTFFGSAKLASSRMDACSVHKLKAARVARDAIYQQARREKQRRVMLSRAI